MSEEIKQKSKRALREEEILAVWQKNHIFEKTLEKESPKGEFVFFEGPPTANGRPGIHHLEARAFKDAIPRFKTMQGFHVRRKGGWDTHGLPVELQVEKELGLKSKKEIEQYGIGKFNQKCKESVWKYVDEWVKFTNRIGYWIDIPNAYVTYKSEYIESLWHILKHVHEQNLLYKDYKVVPWCPRCGTALSSHELAQGYQEVKDLSVYVKFQITSTKSQTNLSADRQDSKFEIPKDKPTYLLAWTTTPWTLPGNVALAVNPDIQYCKVKRKKEEGKSEELPDEIHIVAKARVEAVFSNYEYEVVEEMEGSTLVGLEYEPLYPFLKENLSASEQAKLINAFKVYAADFVTTVDGTGIVHTAVMYGADDFELGTKVGLPKHHLVKEDGTFKDEAGFLAGKFVKSEDTDVAIIKDLHARGLLFKKEKYEHSYPHCWRCKTPLIYFARDSWYIRMSALRDQLVKENKHINWEPAHIKEGRFGEWLGEVKDWAISRERYWGTPLPIWVCEACDTTEVIGSFKELGERAGVEYARFIFLRHGESTKNETHVFSSEKDAHPLTERGRLSVLHASRNLEGVSLDAIISSPILRAKETAELIAEKTGAPLSFDDRLWEVRSGEWDNRGMRDPDIVEAQKPYFADDTAYYASKRGATGESWQEVERRMLQCVSELAEKYRGKTVAVVSHEGPLIFLLKALRDASIADVKEYFKRDELGGYAVPYTVYVDAKTKKEFDPHRPNIDAVAFPCSCGGKMHRVKEVADVWFDSGSMPFAQDHYPFDAKRVGVLRKRELAYPADFISEAIDQTRGWFYTLHAVGTLLGKGRAYKNVICLGLLQDAEGKKMSKSLGNIVDPWAQSDKYGVDTLRFWMYSVNQSGDSKNYDEKTVDEVNKKVFNLLENVLAFYLLYASDAEHASLDPYESPAVLDQWALALLETLVRDVTENLEAYKLLESTRAIREFIGELSQWYIRRSRDRFKSDDLKDKAYALATTRFVLLTLAKLMAPFTPFFAEHLYTTLKGEKESVHLEEWPVSKFKIQNSDIVREMAEVRKVVSLGLEQRSKANIKIRQPLSSFKIQNSKFNITERYTDLIKDELNVKEIVFDDSLSDEVELDTTITPELKEEGGVREIMRKIQDLRKEANLVQSDAAVLSVSTDERGRAFLESHMGALKKATGLSAINFVEVPGEPFTVGDFSYIFSVKK